MGTERSREKLVNHGEGGQGKSVAGGTVENLLFPVLMSKIFTFNCLNIKGLRSMG